jgi:hypothetical protein
MIACTIGMVLLVFFHLASHFSRWVEWFYLKVRTRRQSSD